MPHVARRIQHFLNPASGDTFNIDIATESFMRGGWFGRGPGEGTVKRLLPESHTDFVFAVAAEEFGVALCLVLVALFAFIVIRALARAMRNDDAFTRFAAAGLAILFGMQSAINMAVNLHLIPAKGMTLPFISYGGSSMISLAYAMGMLLALDARAAARGDADGAGRLLSGRERRVLRMARDAPLVLLAAGGTGGHLFPARGAGQRARKNAAPSSNSRPTRAPRISNFPPARCTSFRARPCAAAIRSRLRARPRCSRSAPPRPGRCSAASGPPSWSASAAIRPCRRCARRALRGIPTVLHEQNGVMGRANRALAPRVTHDRHRLSARCSEARPALAEQDHLHRQSGRAAR